MTSSKRTTPDEAIQVLKTDARVDIVFTDVQMPGSLDGFGLAQWIRRERPGMKIIITSGVKRASENAADLVRRSHSFPSLTAPSTSLRASGSCPAVPTGRLNGGGHTVGAG